MVSAWAVEGSILNSASEGQVGTEGMQRGEASRSKRRKKETKGTRTRSEHNGSWNGSSHRK